MLEGPRLHNMAFPTPMVRPLDESQGSSPLQGHGSWLMCEVALRNFSASSSLPAQLSSPKPSILVPLHKPLQNLFTCRDLILLSPCVYGFNRFQCITWLTRCQGSHFECMGPALVPWFFCIEFRCTRSPSQQERELSFFCN